MSSRSSSPSGSDAAGSDSSTPQGPTYTPKELSDILLNFYQFLATLHYNEADLKIPPLEGWTNLTRDVCGDHVSEYALEVMRHIPYFYERPDKIQVHYNSQLIDYTYYTKEDFERQFDYRDGGEFWTLEGIVDTHDVFALAEGHGTTGRYFFLDVQNGEISEDMVNVWMLDAVDIKTYLGNLKEAFRSLKLIPCHGRITIEAWNIPESAEEITEQQVISQEEKWMTDLDIQYIRQLYKHYGWPNHFQKEEAFKAVDDLMDLMAELRGVWDTLY